MQARFYMFQLRDLAKQNKKSSDGNTGAVTKPRRRGHQQAYDSM
jgi:hypothetical protein